MDCSKTNVISKKTIQEMFVLSRFNPGEEKNNFLKSSIKKNSLKRIINTDSSSIIPSTTSEYNEHSSTSPMLSPLSVTAVSKTHDNYIENIVLPKLPFMYPLQEHVHSDLAPSVIASNVEDALKLLSITATFIDQGIICYARTMDGVNFTIQMFSSNKGSTIVEVHRTTAPKFGFQTIVQTIFRASTMRDLVLNASDFQQPWAKRRKVVMQQPSAQQIDDIMKFSLQQVSSLLRKDRLEANLLGTKSLVFLTNRHKVCEEVASKTGQAIFFINNEEDKNKAESYEVGNVVYNLIIHGWLASMNDQDNNDDDEDEHVQMLRQEMRYDALRVFLQCLDILGSTVPGTMLKLSSTRWFGDEMLAVLIEYMCSATTSVHGAHVAHTAVQCVLAMMTSSSSLQAKLQNDDAMVCAVKEAFEVGSSSHELLKRESKKAMVALSLS